MPRKRQRTTQKGAEQNENSYSRQDLAAAVQDVQNGNSKLKTAARNYSIPRSTLRHYVNGTRGKGIVATQNSGGGGKLAIPINDESKLAECLRTLEKWGYGLSKEEVLTLVQMFVEENGLKTPFKNGKPGDEWFVNFKRRHNLSVKKPQGVEYVRMSQNNPFVIYDFFEKLEKIYEEHGLREKPHLIYNCDETSFSSDPSKTKVVGGKGLKCTRMISSAGRDNTTVLMSVSASGAHIPLLCVFKGANIMESWISSTETFNNVSYAASKKGWMDSEIFLNWFNKVFVPNIPKERPVLLIFDGHSSHVSIPLIEAAIAENIILLKLPPHTTHLLQPLDVGVFKGLKSSWDRMLVKWQRENPRRKISKPDFVKTLISAQSGINIENVKNAFKTTGIYDENTGGPNRDVAERTFNFRPAEMAEYRRFLQRRQERDTNSNANIDGEHNEHSRVATKTEHINSATSRQLSPTQLANSSTQLASSSTQQLVPSTVHTSVTMPEITNQRQQGGPKSFEDIILETMMKNKPPASSEHATQPKRRRVCTSAEVITSKEFLEKKRAEQEKEKISLRRKEEKTKKKQNNEKASAPNATNVVKTKKRDNSLKEVTNLIPTTSRAPANSDSSSSEISLVFDDSEDSDSAPVTVIEKDFVVVVYDGLKYPGQVVKIENNKVSVKHMTKAGLNWRWPKQEDILEYDENEILKIIPPPKALNNRGIFTVSGLKSNTFEYE